MEGKRKIEWRMNGIRSTKELKIKRNKVGTPRDRLKDE